MQRCGRAEGREGKRFDYFAVMIILKPTRIRGLTCRGVTGGDAGRGGRQRL